MLHSPAQEASPVKLGKNAERVSFETLAKEDLLLHAFQKKPKPHGFTAVGLHLLRRLYLITCSLSGRRSTGGGRR